MSTCHGAGKTTRTLVYLVALLVQLSQCTGSTGPAGATEFQFGPDDNAGGPPPWSPAVPSAPSPPPPGPPLAPPGLPLAPPPGPPAVVFAAPSAPVAVPPVPPAHEEEAGGVGHERTITLEFPPRRSARRRFPFLKAIVSSLVSPSDRKDMLFEIHNGKGISVQYIAASNGGSKKRSRGRGYHHHHHHHQLTSSNNNKLQQATNRDSYSSASSASNVNNQARESKYIRLHPIEMTSSSSEADLISDQVEDNNLDNNRAPHHRTRGSFLITVLSRMLRTVNITAVAEEMRNGKTSSRASCLACNAVAALYLSPLYSKEAMVVAARSVCISFRLQTPRVCRGLVDSFKDDLDFIRRNTKLTRQEMCGVIFGMDCARTVTPHLNWTVAIPGDSRKGDPSGQGRRYRLKRSQDYPNGASYAKESLLGDNGLQGGPDSGNSGPDALLSVVQITDIHIDPHYASGANADCGEPLCCRAADGYSAGLAKASGNWGDYRNCDTPVPTLRNALRQIRDNHPDANYWMWTGDIAPHDIWNVTRDEVISQIRLVTDLIKEYAKGVPVFPVIGNHEGVPVNSFPPPEVKGDMSISWLYEEIGHQWGYWLPDDAVETLRHGGYYKVKLRPGFRVVCLNTNYCTRLNPWTMFDPVDPGKQLDWLTKELFEAELDGDRVHIIGHIPPDNRECTQAWLYNYLRIIDRFQDTVLAQYFGHTHRDEFRILLSPNVDKPKPISVAYIGPSITSFTENNPAYRVYYMDHQGYVKDHETYFFNLTEANLGAEPIWRREYNAFDMFNMTNLGPFGWHKFVNDMTDDDAMFQKYFKLYYRWSEVKRGEGCYGECKKTIINDLVVGHPLKTKPRSLFGNRNHRH